MESDWKKDYVIRISNATPLGLVNITFELIFKNISLAKENCNSYTKYRSYVEKAKDLLENLIDSLDSEQEISNDLFKVYTTTRGLLIKALVSQYNVKDLDTAIELLNPIAEGFNSIEDTSKASVMQKTPKVYAGLTYGKKGLDEYVDVKTKGFEA